MSDYSPIAVIDKVSSDVQGRIVTSDYQHRYSRENSWLWR